ncbi:MAG: universal stress protein [Desulfonatronovibrio sp. MSAO_Bac4]|nr:MAG: universal stress protein [Desulfonatronovibrio sp. MSAO_Bac4]
MIRKVLQPVDLSESPKDIKARSLFIDRFGGQEIILFHVMNPGVDSRDQSESRISRLEDEIKETGVNARASLATGHVASEIVRAASDEGVDIIYMPASRKNILVSTLMGSVTDDVIRLSDVPVFVHKQRPELAKRKSLDKLMLATDFQKAAVRAKPYVHMLGEYIPELIILHVGQRASDPETEQLRRENVEQGLKEIKKEFAGDYERVKHYARIGSPARHIIETAEQEQAELVVLGRINEPFPSKILGSTCARVTSGVGSSVLLVP